MTFKGFSMEVASGGGGSKERGGENGTSRGGGAGGGASAAAEQEEAWGNGSGSSLGEGGEGNGWSVPSLPPEPEWQGVTLVHFSAQPYPLLSLNLQRTL